MNIIYKYGHRENEILVAKVLYEYYLLPKNQRIPSNYLRIRRSIAEYYIVEPLEVEHFIRKFRETSDKMKNEVINGVTTMAFILSLFEMKVFTNRDICKKLKERDRNPAPTPSLSNNFSLTKEKSEKKINLQYKLIF